MIFSKASPQNPCKTTHHHQVTSNIHRILGEALKKKHEFKKISSKISKKALERSLEITWSHSQRNLDSAIDNEAASLCARKKFHFSDRWGVLETNIIHSDGNIGQKQ